MLETLKKAFKVVEVRRKLIFTFLMLVVIRIGSQLPTPGVDPTYIQEFFDSQTGDAFNFFDAFTGGSFTSMSVFALSISPYITSSIIMQLLTIVFPKLEELQKDGEDGRKKISAYSRYLTVGLALIQSTALAVGFGQSGLLVDYNVVNVIVVILTLTAGTAFLMWIGEQITEHGVGNGISMVLLINIISTIPSDFVTLYVDFIYGQSIAKAILAILIIVAIVVAMIVFVIFLNGGQRRIPVQYSQKIQGRKAVGGQSTHIPMKVNTSGVIPIIFASSIVQFPILLCTFLNVAQDGGIGTEILSGLNSNNWLNPSSMQYSLGLILYIALIVFFAYFYTSITFNPVEIANNMKKRGGFVPGIRPGKPTVDYIASILNYIIFIGAVGLIIVQVVPFFFNGVFGASVSFAGTSLIIIASVTLDSVKQIESQLLVRNYSGFLNK